MKFMWAVVAVLVIMAVVVTLFSVFSDCSGDEEEASAGSVCAAAYVQEPSSADCGYGAYEFTL